jgi:3-hydroxyisobutyrate dehydrogenase-like beta-hydroxyacid dehydrogenase
MIVDIWNNSIFKTYVTETKGEKVINGDFSPSFNLEWALKDMHLASELAREVKSPILLGSIVKQIYSASIANGKKDLDWTAMIHLYEQLASITVSKKD